jgi:hypothetical protein
MNEIQTKRWNQLRTCLANPMTRESWDELTHCLEEWPEGDEKATAFDYFMTVIASMKSPDKLKKAPLAGLWKLVWVEEDRGTVDTDGVSYDVKDVAEIFDFHISEDRLSCEEESALQFYLELHSDGTYRETDFASSPLPVTLVDCGDDSDPEEAERRLRKASYTKLGSVWGISGYEHSLALDEENYGTCCAPKKISTARSVVLHQDHPDEIVEDRVSLREDGVLERRGYVLWDGVYYTLRTLRYRRIASFA